MPRSIRHALRPSPRYFAVLLLGCLLSMGLSYLVVGHWARGLGQPQTPDASQLRELDALRGYANTLVRLTGRYVKRLPLDAPPRVAPQTHAWIDEEFAPALNAARARMAEAQLAHPLLSQLLAAADRMAAMVRNPTDLDRRRACAHHVRQAAAAVEAEIAAAHADLHLSQPAQIPGF